MPQTKKEDKDSRKAKEKTEEIKRILNKLMPIDFIVKTEKPILDAPSKTISPLFSILNPPA